MEESRYPMLSGRRTEEDDDENLRDDCSDSTKISSLISYNKPISPLRRSEEYNSAWPPPQARRRRRSDTCLLWARWTVIVLLQCIIITALLLRTSPELRESEAELKGKKVETGEDINGLYKTLSHSYSYLTFEEEKFVPNMTSNVNRQEVRRNWDMLMPLGSGSVAIPNYKDYPLLGNPITDDPLRSGAIFEASWTHSLHCLYYMVDSYHQLIVNGRSEDDNPYHASHCFEYLRTSIMCNLDMTLEGELSTLGAQERGQPHVCRNRDEAVKWIEARRVDDLQDIIGPAAAI